jgi:predicted metalloprotease with PDZ domain
MNYNISFKNPSTQFIYFDLEVNNIQQSETYIRIPAWRPGRYELGNFAKNIRNWQAFDDRGNLLKFQKVNRDRWVVQTEGISTIHINTNCI